MARSEVDERLVTTEIKRLIPVIGKETAERLNKAYLIGDENTRKRIFELVDVMRAAVMADNDMKDSVLMEPPPESIATDGDIDMGSVLYGRKKMYPLRIKKEMLLTHMGIFGSSGYGKTNLSYNMIKQLSNNGVPVIIFDFSKRNYKDLLATELRERIDLYTAGRNVSPFRFNPLKPPEGIQMSHWMKEFSSVFDHAYWLLGGGRHIILKALDSIHQENSNPRMSDLKKFIDESAESTKNSRERNWIATAERPLESLCFKETVEIFETDEGILPSEFFKPGRITILELDALSDNDKTFFIEIILQWMRYWLLINNPTGKFIGAVILEESHHVLNREKSNRLGSETVMDLIFREVRELGLGVIYTDQHPSLVSYPALGNTSMHIYMNTGLDTKYSSDIQDASRMLGLDYDQDGKYLRELPVGHAFFLSRRSGFPHPFLVEFPVSEVSRGTVTDSDIAKHMKDKIVLEERPDTKSAKAAEGDMDENDIEIIKLIGQGKCSFKSEIYNYMRISGNAFNERLEKLMKMGIVGVRKGKSRRNRLFYCYLMPTGERIFEEKFGKVREEARADTAEIERKLSSEGWQVSRAGSEITITKGGQTSRIKVQEVLDKKNIKDALKEYRYFAAASEEIKNMVIQEAAKLSELKELFVATADELKERGYFGRIEFIPRK